ncbi:hypothetical protein SpAn4DRAFT_0284 [Sporomusa ovata]|uniref:Uncharacterized protein n=2 Tax=Sporomusa ovata TaxID=2378 RepID=A0A0U1L2B5_9FIRM|nr:hypothetical protein SpAn4DRAFT_0284 [Sporomusa ovata]
MLHYLILVIVVIILGLLSRAIGGVPKWVGDILWGLIGKNKTLQNNGQLSMATILRYFI